MRNKIWLLIFVVYVILFVLIYNYIPKYLDLPRWSAGFFYLCGFFLGIEILGRVNPKKSKGNFSFVWQSSVRDKVMLLLVTTSVIVFNLLEGYFFKKVPTIIGIIISISNVLPFKILLNLLGSSEFKQVFNQKVKLW